MCVYVAAHTTLTAADHHLVEFALDVQLWMLGLDALELDGHLVAGSDICT